MAGERVSVVMPVRNGAGTLPGQLAALAAQSYRGDWELVVVDNGSTDGSDRVLAAWRDRLPRLRVHHEARRAGASHARNAGCRVATGELLLFCDHDDVVDARWVEAMARGLARYPAVGGRVERESLNDAVALAARPQRDGLLDGGFGFLPYPLGANCGVRREVWTALGGFDPGYPHGSDDVEFFWRAQLAGYPVGYVPDAVVHYRLRPDITGMMRQYYSYGRSHARLYRQFRAAGMPRSLPGALAGWLLLAARAGRLAGTRRGRALWLTRAAMRCGRIAGSLRNRVLYP